MPHNRARILESADRLRHLLDRAPVQARTEPTDEIRAQARRLHQRSRAATRERTAYPALHAGLAEFAQRTLEHRATQPPGS